MVRNKDKEEESSRERKKDQRGWRRERGKKKRGEEKAHSRESNSHPVFGEKQIDGGVSNDVHAQLEGLDLPGFSWLGDLGYFHSLVVSRQEELPQAVPEKRKIRIVKPKSKTKYK